MSDSILRVRAVIERVGLRRTSIHLAVKAGTFPAPVRLGARATGWRESDINRWIAERVSTRSAK